MQTGSLINDIMLQTQTPEIEVGMGATKLMFSDRYPFTVIDIIDKNTLLLQADDYERVDNNGMSDAQKYEFTQNPTNPTYVVTRRKNGCWVTKGQGMKNGQHWSIGTRSKYFDFSF